MPASQEGAVADSVPLEVLQEGEGRGKKAAAPRVGVNNLKVLLALFLIFVFVVSEVFTNSVIAGFGDRAVRCRAPTSWGIVLQGIFLVIFYILAVYLVEHRVL